MGSQQSIQKCNFEDVQQSIQNNSTIIINTLTEHNQDCLIQNTTLCSDEIKLINHLLKTNTSARIIVYGKHTNDKSVYKKYTQLLQLGFTNVLLYSGGLFEWLCLQDIYGDDIFLTTKKELDILRYKPSSAISKNFVIENG